MKHKHPPPPEVCWDDLHLFECLSHCDRVQKDVTEPSYMADFLNRLYIYI